VPKLYEKAKDFSILKFLKEKVRVTNQRTGICFTFIMQKNCMFVSTHHRVATEGSDSLASNAESRVGRVWSFFFLRWSFFFSRPLDNIDVRKVKRAVDEEGELGAGKANVAKQLEVEIKLEKDLLEADRKELFGGDVKVEAPRASEPRPPEVIGVIDANVFAAQKRARKDAPVAARLDRLRMMGHAEEALDVAQLEPTRSKCHWDHLLEEAVWLAREVHGERAWKQKAARQVAHAAKKGLEEMAKIKGGTIGNALRKEGDEVWFVPFVVVL
jgi:hypothetical protein